MPDPTTPPRYESRLREMTIDDTDIRLHANRRAVPPRIEGSALIAIETNIEDPALPGDAGYVTVVVRDPAVLDRLIAALQETREDVWGKPE